MIDLSKYKKRIFDIAKVFDLGNDYNKYRKHTHNELAKGIAAEIAFKIHKKLRPAFEFYLDKNGDGGTDVLGYDVKYIPSNGRYLILYPGEIFKAEKYAAVRISDDFNNAEIIGEITANDFAEKYIIKNFGYGDRFAVSLNELNQ